MLVRLVMTLQCRFTAQALCAVVCVVFNLPAVAAPVVWSGHTYEFTRPSFANPAPVDPITGGVSLARGEIQGLYNSAVDSGWTGNGPTGTSWATAINNPGKIIAAENWADLQFSSWTAAYGGGGSLAYVITENDAVVHLLAQDIYLDLRFSSWDVRGGGGFIYLRAEAPLVPEPAWQAMLLIFGTALALQRRAARTGKRCQLESEVDQTR
jgi:hypothetical protein